MTYALTSRSALWAGARGLANVSIRPWYAARVARTRRSLTRVMTFRKRSPTCSGGSSAGSVLGSAWAESSVRTVVAAVAADATAAAEMN
ncbi:MAG TPA: hypothetical protein VLJ88_04005 [Propionibacteriaceae bacterium]|nr:hypothetical protein [Propionibacteriaceae bacterium]